MTPPRAPTTLPRHSRLRWLLLLPFLGVLWVPFYNRIEPALFGVPFFYWYQMLWILLTAVLVGVIYRAEHRPGDSA